MKLQIALVCLKKEKINTKKKKEKKKEVPSCLFFPRLLVVHQYGDNSISQ